MWCGGNGEEGGSACVCVCVWGGGVESSDSAVKPVVLSFIQDSAWLGLGIVSGSFQE